MTVTERQDNVKGLPSCLRSWSGLPSHPVAPLDVESGTVLRWAAVGLLLPLIVLDVLVRCAL